MRWFEKIIACHTAVTDKVSHGGRLDDERYFVWQEDGADDFEADGVHAEKAITGTTDLFTKQEFDPWREEFEAALDVNPDIRWSLNSVQYEEETEYWHYEWEWKVSDG